MPTSEELRLDVLRWRDQLAKAYEAAPGPPGAAVVLSMLQEQYNTMRSVYTDTIYIPAFAGVPEAGASPFKRKRLERLFRPWVARMDKFGQRLDTYWSDACLPADPCPDPEDVQPAYTTAWVAKPVLEGVWPPDYYLGFETPGHADAIEAAMLWNELTAVQDVIDDIGDSADQLLLELIDRAGVQLSASAKGEDKTFADAVDAALEALGDGLDDLFTGFGDTLKYVGMALGLGLVGWIGYRLIRKD